MGILGLATVFTALWTVPQAELQWQLRFKFLAAYVVFDTVLTQALTILAALAGLKAYSFFLPLVITNLLLSTACATVSNTGTPCTSRPRRPGVTPPTILAPLP